jgi:aspartyl-tRNA(Asn)/glutamyl-tRNA(Gln) amidotransferase subunit C
MALDKATVAHVAHLARIRLEAAEIERMSGELSRILNWVEQLSEVKTDDVPPMTSVVEMKLVRRKDEITDGGKAEAVLANAPEAMHGFFTVPKVVE